MYAAPAPTPTPVISKTAVKTTSKRVVDAPRVVSTGHRAQLAAFYARFNPNKAGDVDALLLKYRGKETKLFKALLKK